MLRTAESSRQLNFTSKVIEHSKNIRKIQDILPQEFYIYITIQVASLSVLFIRAVHKLLGNFWATFQIWSNF